jgi:dolichol kinase
MFAATMFPVLALLLDGASFFKLLLAVTLIILISDLSRLLIRPFNRLVLALFHNLLRHTEETNITGASYLLLGMLATFYLFPKDIAILAMFFLALGDPVAAIVGTRAPGMRIHRRSPCGSGAMAITSLALIYILHITGQITFQWQAIIGAMVASAAELLPLPTNDNLLIPISAAGAMLLLGF